MHYGRSKPSRAFDARALAPRVVAAMGDLLGGAHHLVPDALK